MATAGGFFLWEGIHEDTLGRVSRLKKTILPPFWVRWPWGPCHLLYAL